ncbi:MAG: peptidoglycan DD-metalloendopeptidase family protein [Gammaproteobacteria bacterium]
MTRVKSQIQHDYKSLVKPAGRTPSPKTHRWFLIGMGIPVALVALILLLSPGGSSQTAIAATGDNVADAPLSVAAALPAPVAITQAAEPVVDADDAVAPATTPRKTDVAKSASKTARIEKPLDLKPVATAPSTGDSAPSAVASPAAPTPGVTRSVEAKPLDAQPATTRTPPTVADNDAATGSGSTRPLALPAPTRIANLEQADSAEELSGQPLTLTISPGDTLDELFNDNDLSRTDLANILAIKDAKAALTLLMPGDKIDVRHQNKNITYLSRQLDEVRTLHVRRGDEGFTTHVTEQPVEVRINRASATITSSLFLAAKAAGISDTLTMNLAGIFAWDIDFVLDIRQGDRFSVIYEEIWQNGKRLRDGTIVAALFENDGDEFKALRYVDPDGNAGYFTPEGVNVKKAFLRAPIKFTPRVTSNFNPKRLHPVHKRVRPHRGVDYGAPTGTPIIAAGDGKVIFRGRKGGYGNTVILQHGSNITTLYAHMSKFNRKVRNGSRVKQGQVIGYVGATGTVTARHLHYEYRLNGVHRNPRTVSLPKAKPIPKKLAQDFRQATTPLLNQLNVVSRDKRVAMAP